jgi:soluble lytic murein transglycosylase-like protein
MRMRNVLFLLPALVSLFFFEQNSHGQTLYSYVDEDGIQVFTNLAPTNPTWDLKITGSDSSPTPADSKSKFEFYDAIIEKYASDYRLDPSLIRSIIATESGFNPKAVSPKGARGLMQLMPATAERLGVTNSFDPEENIRGGAKHFRYLLDNFNNNLELSLAAYNAGENLVQRLGRVPEIKETRAYVKSVTARYGKSELDTQSQEDPKHPPMFRYFDESGVLHLTNIPPTN